MTKLYVGYRVGFWTGNLHQLVSRYSSEFRSCLNCPIGKHYWMISGYYDISASRVDSEIGEGNAIFNLLFCVQGPSTDDVKKIISEMSGRMNIELRRPSPDLEERLAAQRGLKVKPQATQS